MTPTGALTRCILCLKNVSFISNVQLASDQTSETGRFILAVDIDTSPVTLELLNDQSLMIRHLSHGQCGTCLGHDQRQPQLNHPYTQVHRPKRCRWPVKLKDDRGTDRAS